MKVVIKKTGINGEGIGYIDRLPVFVAGALVDEEVDIRVVERKKRYAIGEVNRIIKKSKDRIQPKCRMQHICGLSLIHIFPINNGERQGVLSNRAS